MMQRLKKAAIFIAIIAVLVVFGLFNHMASKVKLNDNYVNGNTPGNLYNYGMFAEYDGTVYFSNPDDAFCLYSMSADGTDLKKLSNDVPVFLNADEHYLYYARNNSNADGQFSFLHIDTNSVCRIKKSGGKSTVLEHDPSFYVALSKNNLYYLHYDTSSATTLYRIGIDGVNREQVDKNPYYTCDMDGQYLYYNGLENDHCIYRMNTETGASTMVLEANAWMPIISGDYIYYMDCEQNYAIVRANLSTGEKETIVSERVDCYNLDHDLLVYQTGDTDSPALYRANADGSNQTMIVAGNHTNINITSKTIYFMNYDDESTIYMCQRNASLVEAFHPGTE